MDVRDQLLLQYSYLTDGESEAGQLCPVCRGGSGGEHSLSVSRAGDTLLWNCHRASCRWSGAAGSNRRSLGHARGRTRTPVLRGVVGRTYYRQATELPSELVEILEGKYYLNQWERSDLGWCAAEERVVIPVHAWQGELLGAVLRSEKPAAELNGRPKAMSHTEDNAVATWRNFESDDVMIVEDCYSAKRISKYMNGAAILGTHLNPERIATIKELKPKRAFLALDLDAYDKAIKYVTKYRSDLRMIPLKLTKDIKNLNPTELKEFVDAL